jgi:hypothetical protein
MFQASRDTLQEERRLLVLRKDAEEQKKVLVFPEVAGNVGCNSNRL